MNVSLSHFSESKNTTRVVIFEPDSEDGVQLFFSYTSVIAFRTAEDGLRVTDEYLTVTTEKHKTLLDKNKSYRVPTEEFDEELKAVLERIQWK